jgi:hypothetical protein
MAASAFAIGTAGLLGRRAAGEAQGEGDGGEGKQDGFHNQLVSGVVGALS